MNGLQTVSKAIAGAVVAGLVAWLAKNNIVLDSSISEAINVIIAAVIGFAGVYVAPKNREPGVVSK